MAQERVEARPGLDALSQTIEGLEARLSEMMEARASGIAPRGPARSPDYRDRAPRERRLPAEPANARLDAELRDISRTLKDLRQSVRDDFTASLRDELAGLHTMLSQIERQTDTRDIDDDTRSELLRISEGVDWLLSNAAADDDSRLMAEFDHLQTLLRGLADAKSVARLESRFDTLERQIAPFDPARLDLELTALARGLDDVRRFLENDDSGHSLQEIEARMAGLAEAMEVLCARIPASGDRLDGQMHAIERRIDDIDRNLERIGRRQSETPRDPAVERLEARLGDLSNAVAAVVWQMRDQSTKQATLLENLDAVARRIESHNSADAHTRLEARIEALAGAVERIGTERNTLGKAVATLSDKVGDIDLTSLERRIAAKLDSVGAGGLSEADRREIKDQIGHLAGLIETRDPRAIEDAVNRLNDNIAGLDLKGAERRLAQKIETAGSDSFSAHDRRELKSQLSNLATLIENRRGIEPAALEDAVSRITGKIGQIDFSAAERRLAAQISAMPVAGADPELRRKIEANLETESRVVERLDALDIAGLEERLSRKIAAVEQNGAESRLSAQLTALANRLEESRRDKSGPELQKLERQIAELTTLMNRPEPKLPIGELEERIGARIEALSASNDDLVIEAAQHAAEEALKNFEAGRKGENDEHIEIIKGLAADLKALRIPANADQDKASAGLHDTLKTIASRLDAMPGVKAQEAPDTAGTPETREKPLPRPRVQPTTPLGPPPFETRFHAGSSDAKPEEDGSQDVLDILSRVRAGQKNDAMPSHGPVLPVHERPAAESRKGARSKPAGVISEGLGPRTPRADLIAAARRAVHTAVEETGETETTETAEPPKDRFSRRPVYLAGGAILLAIMAYPLLTGMGRDRDAILQAAQSLDAATIRREAPAPAPVKVSNAAPATIDLTMTPVVKNNFAAEAPEEVASAPVRAFSMIETDNVVTGSIEPDATTDAAGPSPVAEKLKKAAAALEDKTEEAVETAAVTTRDVLDVLNTPAKASPEAVEAKTSVATAPATDTASPQTNVVTEASETGFRPITADLPAGLETKLLADAATAGDPAALYEIGLRYLDGLGFKQDLSKAAFWFELAAERGSAPAAFQLGSLYEKGTGVDEDAGKAVSLYREAAQKGNVSAMHNLAVMLANGADGGKPDFTEAAEWFQKAADHGVADSQFNLAILHARGAGADADLVQSYKWFAVAAREGDAEAAKRRDEVAEALGNADLNRARKLAENWKAEPLDDAANRLTSPKEWTPADLVAASAPVDKETVVRDIQTILNKNGYDAGPADGVLGAKTDAAIKAFQKANGFAADGAITPELVKALLARNSA
ncbi:peptidoglycan-binding protein [Martelella mediterranea]|uniref:peptidoglycan-binding protein n=1 Tax=Martelella mediterranea TaxID=293089 RepID=UPI001E4AEE5E|nr:peptidoglycan-binding protein [Martelella mediterranea]MCD1634406.1 peptidoglycan-binding protein [Martelella mediterranea]